MTPPILKTSTWPVRGERIQLKRKWARGAKWGQTFGTKPIPGRPHLLKTVPVTRTKISPQIQQRGKTLPTNANKFEKRQPAGGNPLIYVATSGKNKHMRHLRVPSRALAYMKNRPRNIYIVWMLRSDIRVMGCFSDVVHVVATLLGSLCWAHCYVKRQNRGLIQRGQSYK